MYKYIHTCIYIHISYPHTYTHTHIYTHAYKMCTWTHAKYVWNDTAIAREAQLDTKKLCPSPCPHHDSAPSRPHPLICTGAEPIHPVPRQLPAWPWPPETRSFFCHFGGVWYDNIATQYKRTQVQNWDRLEFWIDVILENNLVHTHWQMVGPPKNKLILIAGLANSQKSSLNPRDVLLWRDTTVLRKLIFLHELTISTKNRISKSVYSTWSQWPRQNNFWGDLLGHDFVSQMVPSIISTAHL